VRGKSDEPVAELASKASGGPGATSQVSDKEAAST